MSASSFGDRAFVPAASSPQAVSPVPASIPSAKAIAFTNETGDRFIFPSWIIYVDDPAGKTRADYWFEANAICARGELKQEWIDFNPERFPHVEGSIGSSMFLHGSATVLFFAGPQFDAVAQGTSASGQDPQGLEAKPAGPVRQDAPDA